VHGCGARLRIALSRVLCRNEFVSVAKPAADTFADDRRVANTSILAREMRGVDRWSRDDGDHSAPGSPRFGCE